MQPVRVPAEQGARWIGDGWRAFMATPGMWLVLAIIWVLVLAALQLIPLVGTLASYLIGPALAGGLLTCARDSLGGRSIDPGQLFDPLTRDDTRGPILVLGALFLVANLVLAVLGMMLFAGGAGMLLLEHGGALGEGGATLDAAAAAQLGLGALLGVLVVFTLGLLVTILFYYAIPLVMFAGVRPSAAIGLGVRGIVRNWLALLVLGVLWLMLSVLATIPLFLGWLVLLPLTFGAWFASYRDVYPMNEPASGIEPASGMTTAD
jgi:uncharacterized membrane protein